MDSGVSDNSNGSNSIFINYFDLIIYDFTGDFIASLW